MTLRDLSAGQVLARARAFGFGLQVVDGRIRVRAPGRVPLCLSAFITEHRDEMLQALAMEAELIGEAKFCLECDYAMPQAQREKLLEVAAGNVDDEARIRAILASLSTKSKSQKAEEQAHE